MALTAQNWQCAPAQKSPSPLIARSFRWTQGIFCPGQQVFFFHGEGTDVIAAGLEDGHADGFDVVDSVIGVQCAEGVAHHLRIVFLLLQGCRVHI